MVDNLITMISINVIQIKDAIAKNGIHVHADIIKFLDLIESKNFNSTKCWLAVGGSNYGPPGPEYNLSKVRRP